MATKTKTKPTKQPINKELLLTEKIITLLERGTVPWRKPWFAMPYQNLASGHIYRGANPLLCAIDCLVNDRTEPYFLSFKDGQKLGLTLKKGSESTWIKWGGSGKAYYAGDKRIDAQQYERLKASGSSTNLNTKFYSAGRWHNVFHISCWTAPETNPDLINELVEQRAASLASQQQAMGWSHQALTTVEQQAVLNRVVQQTHAVEARHQPRIGYNGNECFYSPDLDQIQMAPRNTFSTDTAFYTTLFHELVHWTGHLSRLGRLKPGASAKFGTRDYAAEELVAELGCLLLTQHPAIAPALNLHDPTTTSLAVEHHASYLDSWLRLFVVPNTSAINTTATDNNKQLVWSAKHQAYVDTSALFEAMTKATKASDWLAQGAGLVPDTQTLSDVSVDTDIDTDTDTDTNTNPNKEYH